LTFFKNLLLFKYMVNQQDLAEKEIAFKIKRIQEILNAFLEEIAPLEKEQVGIVEKILERVDKEKIEEIKKTLQKLSPNK